MAAVDIAPSPPSQRRKWWAWALLGLILAGAALLGWGYWVETWPPLVRRAVIVFDTPAMAGRKIDVALVSDIHVGSHGMSAARLDRVVDQVMAQHPDAILLAGDFVNGDRRNDPAVRLDLLPEALGRLHAPLGVFAVLGNHDQWTDPRAVTALLHRAGITVLNNQSQGVGPITLLGLADTPRARLIAAPLLPAARAAGKPVIVVEHVPRVIPGVPLILAGHTHCGQIHLPGISIAGNPITGNRYYDARFRCGIVRWQDQIVLIGSGVGSGSFPLRIGTRPDFWMITLTGR